MIIVQGAHGRSRGHIDRLGGPKGIGGDSAVEQCGCWPLSKLVALAERGVAAGYEHAGDSVEEHLWKEYINMGACIYELCSS